MRGRRRDASTVTGRSPRSQRASRRGGVLLPAPSSYQAARRVRSRQMSFFARLAVSWAVNAAALGVAGWLLHGVTFHHSAWTLILAAAVFGVLNTILKPVLKLLT